MDFKKIEDRYLKKYGEPDINILGFLLWVHNYEFIETNDPEDSNWLICTYVYLSEKALAADSGPFVRTIEFAEWLDELNNLDIKGQATLNCLEPNLNIELEIFERGNGRMTVEMIPEGTNNHLTFVSENLDFSYISILSSQIKSILKKYPIK